MDTDLRSSKHHVWRATVSLVGIYVFFNAERILGVITSVKNDKKKPQSRRQSLVKVSCLSESQTLGYHPELKGWRSMPSLIFYCLSVPSYVIFIGHITIHFFVFITQQYCYKLLKCRPLTSNSAVFVSTTFWVLFVCIARPNCLSYSSYHISLFVKK